MSDQKPVNQRVSQSQADFVPGPAWRAAEEAGFDMSLVELSLGKTAWDRLLDHDRALAQAELLKDAMRRHGKT